MKSKNRVQPEDQGVNVTSLLERLDFAPENIIMAACEQPGLFKQAADYRMERFRVTAKAKMAHEVGEAMALLKLRREAKANGDKITEGNLKELVLVDEEVQKLATKLSSAEEREEWAKLMLEAFRQRRDCLRIVEDLVGQENATKQYFERSSEQMNRTREELKKKYPG